jgi:parvulin-like peptidyl-prolyl isomerase
MNKRIVVFLLLLLVACTPAATPEVIQYTSAAPTAARSPTHSGPTGTPTLTSTPYIRPTDDPALHLDQPIVRVGDEMITLGQFRQRVRYERFAALDNARRLIERVGLDKVNLATPGENPTADAVASIFNTLANSNAFGHQVYDIMVRESIIRQEYHLRGLKVNPKDVRDYWVRYLDLQRAPDVDAALKTAQEAYITTAMSYSGLSRAAIEQIFEVYVMGLDLRPIIAKERMGPLTIQQVKVRRIIAKTLADAQAALAQIKKGDDFRSVVCQYSTERGSSDMGYVTRGQFVPGLKNPDAVFKANTGEIVGPLQSPLGWYIFRIKDLRKNADGDTQADVQSILVATESAANDLKSRAQQGEDFERLACLYSLDKNAGIRGDLGYVDPASLGDAVAQAINGKENGLYGPIATGRGFEVIQVDDRKVNLPKPEEIDRTESQTFSAWQSDKVNSSYVAALNDVWQKAIPADPLPRDVSPLMREENFGLPTLQPTGTDP